MARTLAKVMCSLWDDDDFCTLSANAQRTYILVLSQPKLSLVGAIDYLPARWAGLASDVDPDLIAAGVDELAEARFFLVDKSTDEVAVRTLAKHDLPDKPNINQLKGVWSAWQAITSRRLRTELVHNLPDHLFDDPRHQPPAEALEIRRSGPMERTVETSLPDGPSEPTDATSINRLPSAAAASAADFDERPSYLTTTERQQLFEAAVSILTDLHMARTETRGTSRNKHRRSVYAGKITDHRQAGHQHLIANPALEPCELAALLEPPSTAPPGVARPPDWKPTAVPDALDHDAGAERIRALRADRQPAASS